MKLATRLSLALVTTALLHLAIVAVSPAAISVTSNSFSYTQNFDSLSATSWSNDSTLPGWSLFRQPATAPVAIAAIALNTGGSTAGSFYGFGSAGEIALGGLGSGGTYFGSPSTGNVAGWMAASFTNDSGGPLDSFTLHYDGEQWRNGGNATQQMMVFEYGFGANFTNVASWTAPGATFDFTSPIATASAAALDGNAEANRVANLGGTIQTPWNASDTLWIRWIEKNDAGNDHGLAADNFSFSVSGGRTNPQPFVGDYNDDGVVDGADYVIWRRNLTDSTALPANETQTPGTTDQSDYDAWRANYGNVEVLGGGAGLAGGGGVVVPEPSSYIILLVLVIAAGCPVRIYYPQRSVRFAR